MAYEKINKKLYDATEAAIAKAIKDKPRFGNDSINWSCLCCVRVECVEAYDSEGHTKTNYQVYLEELGSTCFLFRDYLLEELGEVGFVRVTVHMEW